MIEEPLPLVTSIRGYMRQQLLISLMFALGLGIVSPASAETSAEERAKMWFNERDRNHDGFLTVAEVVPYELKIFKRKDAAGAGTLSIDEYCAGIPSDLTGQTDQCHRRFVVIDTRGDGVITPEEIADYFTRVLGAADKNGDGKVSLDEWLASPDSR